ncbi:MAG TPA: hypothetical protein VM261_32455 [Kofleriaceae bacterium]|nr:hypothetical protein [Kofleriaceae bacterium]
MRRLAIVAAVLLASSALAQTDGPAIYATSERAAHLDRALATLQALGPDGARAFENEVYQAMRTRCRPSGMQPPAVACLATAADAVCATRSDGAGCAAAADVVVTNLHAENAFVPETTRMRLVAAGADYHAGVMREMRTRLELLASELVLAMASSGGAKADGARIDAFCAERDREVVACEPGAKLCVPSLPWQRCVAGLVWYVSTPEEEKKAP